MDDKAKISMLQQVSADFDKYRMVPSEEKNFRILMLDDTQTDVELVERLLTSAGLKYISRRVDNEDDFKKALDFFVPDIILLDNSLPTYNGTLALSYAQEVMPKVPCIFVSGSIGDDMVVELMRKGATDYVMKQNMDRLVPVLRRVMKEIEENLKLKYSQNLLKQSEENLRQIAENIGEIFFLFDPITPKMLYVSPAYERIFGEPPETLYINPDSWFEYFDEMDRAKVRKTLSSAMIELNMKGVGENYSIKRKDGEVRYLGSRFFGVKNGLGEIYRVAGFMEDITEKVRDDAKIEELNKLRNEFVHVVSHQLRTPFTVILWVLQGIVDLGDQNKDKIDLASVGEVLNAAQKISSRIEDMITALDIVEGETVKTDDKCNSLDVILNEALSAFNNVKDKKNISFEYIPSVAKLSQTKCDSKKIVYIFRKLIENAYLYTNEGGKIKVSLSNTDNAVRFEVTDTGVGIPKDDQPRIFSTFFRAGNAELMSPDGSGISLSVVKKYIENEGGRVGFESEEGKGSTFWFELPIRADVQVQV